MISDEIYHRLAYSAPDVTALEFCDRRHRHQFVLEILLHDRLARSVGWCCPSLVRPVERIPQSLYISPPEISQVAAIEASNT